MQVFLFLKIISFSLYVDIVHGYIGKAWQIPTSKVGSATLSLCFRGRCLLGKAKLLHESLWLWIVTAEVAVDHCLVLCTTLLKDVLAE